MKLRPYLLLLLLSLIVYLPVMKHAAEVKVDFRSHNHHALTLPAQTSRINYVLYHAIFLSIHRLAPFAPQSDASLAAILLFMLPVPLMVYALLRRAAGEKLPLAILIALSLALTILAPVTIWFPRYMIGYLNPIVYHNATSIAARLFVIPLSLLAFRIYRSQPDRSLNQRVYIVLLSASVVLLGTLAKPSFTLVLLPSCCLFAIWRAYRRARVDWLLLLCGFCIPGSIMMGLQYLLTFASVESESAFAFGFLVFMKKWIPTWLIPMRFLQSLVFPLAVIALYFEQARRNLYLIMCWAIFAVGAASVYFLYEDGPRIAHGNFLWGGYNAIFLLMFASLLFMVEQFARESERDSSDFTIFGIGVSRRMAIATLAFGLHLLSGIIYWRRFIG